MRIIRRTLRRLWSEARIAGRRQEVARALVAALDLPTRAQLLCRNGMGHDSTYLLVLDGVKLGVLRLLNPHKNRPLPRDGQPYMIPDGEARIDREWQAYQRGAQHGLTPRP